MPEDHPVGNHHRMKLRAWLAVLPWHLIYALGTVILVILLALPASLIE
jgi:hypothetical protein